MIAFVRQSLSVIQPMITDRQPASGQIDVERIWAHVVHPKGELQHVAPQIRPSGMTGGRAETWAMA